MTKLSDILKYSIDDKSAIIEYLSQPELINESVKMLTKLIDRMTNGLKDSLIYQLDWNSQSYGYYYKEYPFEIASKFDRLTHEDILGLDFSEADKKWLSNLIPTLNTPTNMWEYLYYKILDAGYRFNDTTDRDVELAKTSLKQRSHINPLVTRIDNK